MLLLVILDQPDLGQHRITIHKLVVRVILSLCMKAHFHLLDTDQLARQYDLKSSFQLHPRVPHAQTLKRLLVITHFRRLLVEEDRHMEPVVSYEDVDLVCSAFPLELVLPCLKVVLFESSRVV